MDDELTIGADGLARDAEGRIPTTFITSGAFHLMSFRGADVIAFRLFDRTEPTPGQLPRSQVVQLRMPLESAERLALTLLDCVQQARGAGMPRQ